MRNDELIFVTGCARSGTSLTTGILAALGLNLGPVNVLNECIAAREGVVKPYLRRIGADPRCQNPLPDMNRIEPDPDWRNKITSAVGQAEPWGYKCAKAVLFWPLWVKHFPEAKWVIVRRDRRELIDCLMRTGFMSGHKTREGWGGWIDTHRQRELELMDNADCIVVRPRDFIADADAFLPVARHCGLTLDRSAVLSTVKPGLFKRSA